MRGVEKLFDTNANQAERVNLYKESLEKMKGVLFIFDYKTIGLNWAADNFTEILGYRNKSLSHIGVKGLKELYHPDDFHIFKERHNFFMNPATKDQSHTCVCRIKHKKGHYLMMYFSVFVISRNPDGTPHKAGGIMINLEKLMVPSFLEKHLAEHNRLKDNKPIKLLSKRQNEILHYIRQGLSAAQVAKELNVSIRTIESHKRNIQKRLGFNNTAAVISYVSRMEARALAS